MASTNHRLSVLFDQFLAGTAGEEELEELWQQLKTAPDNDPIRVRMEGLWESEQQPNKMEPDWNEMYQRIQASNPTKTHETQQRRIYRWLPPVAAAMLLLFAGTYYFLNQQAEAPQHAVVSQTLTEPDVPPGGNRAVLTLSDGSTLLLDEGNNGELAVQGNSRVVRLDSGKIVYQSAKGKDAATITYNTLTTPRGGQFQLSLPDGTQVWLNAASSIRYPTAFIGNGRRVAITGEVYFEVQRAAQPFKVSTPNGAEVEVLGTHFNINAYADEKAINTTLLEGSVRVRSNDATLQLAPGQQARITNQLELVSDANLDQVMAWKNGAFYFDQVSLRDIMRQLSRWYDIEVQYEGNVPDISFGGKMGRDVSLSKLLHFFKGSGVHFRIEENGKQLTVLP